MTSAPATCPTTRLAIRSRLLRRQRASPRCCCSAAAPRGKLLLLGGTGFVGSAVAERALAAGWAVTSVSRRGAPSSGNGIDYPPALVAGVDWRTGDATAPDTARAILAEGGYTAVVHCVGMLLANDWNRFASGSASVPAEGATYDAVTRQSALAAAAAAAELCERPAGAAPPFLFISAAEAGWTFEAPVEFLRLYLAAKRAVERELTAYGSSGILRPLILRPSLVYTTARPAALPAVALFWAANAVGAPAIDAPVTVDTLAAAAVAGLVDGAVSGVLRYTEMERLALRR